MKKVFKYFGVLLSVALMGAVTACNPTEIEESTDIGLGIKVFFPTKVVAGQPMTINGSGLSDVREIIFPEGVSVTNFEIVSNDMIRVIAPSGIAAAGGNLKVRTADDEAESRVALTLGRTDISGYSKQDGETIDGGEQLTIYGKDLEFISRIELLDTDGNPLILEDEDFYRKGTSSVIITIPKTTIFDGTFVGKAYTFDGREFSLPELTYVPGSEGGGHWETVETVIWENPDPDGYGPANWNGTYRFAPETNSTGEEIYAIPTDLWEKMKTTPFRMLARGSDWIQMRIVTGWWNHQWPAADNDITSGNEMIIDNGDGTYYIELDLSGSGLAANMDAEHLLFTGSGFTPLKLYFSEDIWVDGGGHWETVKSSIWKNELGNAVSWSSDYRFAGEGHSTGEEIYTIPADIWEKMKTTTFYIDVTATDPQIRVTTGWWSGSWADKDFQPGDERLVDNGDGTWTLAVSLFDPAYLDLIDEQHLLFTGDRYTPIEIYFTEETWIDGDDSSPAEVVVWEGDGSAGAISWSSTYRYAGEGHSTGEEIYTFPADVWEKIKSGTFYVLLQGEDPQIRVTSGWWSTTWTGADIQPGNEKLTDNGDGTWTLEVNLTGDPLLDVLDEQHLLLTGDRYTPMKIFFLE